jgi:hypothetical protein
MNDSSCSSIVQGGGKRRGAVTRARTARALHRQRHPQRHHHIDHIAAGGGFLESLGHLAPCLLTAERRRQMLFDQPPHVGQRRERHDLGDKERPRQTLPVRAGQLGNAPNARQEDKYACVAQTPKHPNRRFLSWEDQRADHPLSRIQYRMASVVLALQGMAISRLSGAAYTPLVKGLNVRPNPDQRERLVRRTARLFRGFGTVVR